MHAPNNNHTCSVVPLWRVNNSDLFLYPWKEGKKIKISNSCWKKWHGWLQKKKCLL